MTRRTAPAPDPRVAEVARQMRELAVELAGPGASFEEVELFVDTIREELAAQMLREEREERAATAAPARPPRSTRAKPRGR